MEESGYQNRWIKDIYCSNFVRVEGNPFAVATMGQSTCTCNAVYIWCPWLVDWRLCRTSCISQDLSTLFYTWSFAKFTLYSIIIIISCLPIWALPNRQNRANFQYILTSSRAKLLRISHFLKMPLVFYLRPIYDAIYLSSCEPQPSSHIWCTSILKSILPWIRPSREVGKRYPVFNSVNED